jgi:imidazolonepropionase-like amidohydrolase
MRHKSLLLLVCALGCVGKEKPASPKAPQEKGPALEAKAETWTDPEEGATKGQKRAAKTRATPGPVIIRHATILTAAGKRIEDGSLVMENGLIKAIGDNSLAAPSGAKEIDAKGRYLTPGIIDAHSHLGVYPSPGDDAVSDGNEAVSPVTASAASEYAYWPQDPGITRAQAGGVTAALILPGSANMVGGLATVVEMRTGQDSDEVRFPEAPRSIKMACGENPKRVYGNKGGPQTRMGLYAAFRATFQGAADYRQKRATYQKERKLWEERRGKAQELDKAEESAGRKGRVKPESAPTPPGKDAKLEVLADVLDGKILVQVHCYRASDILEMVDIADEFGFQIQTFHHALEAYKVRDVLTKKNIAIATWADWWGFKLEAFDGIPENAPLFAESGGKAIIHSDSEIGIQRLNQEAAKAMYAGRAAGIDISEDTALRWITANPAWALGIDKKTGTLEAGKRADVVLCSGSPFSVYSRADDVFIGGELVYDRLNTGKKPTDFELGNSAFDGGAK